MAVLQCKEEILPAQLSAGLLLIEAAWSANRLSALHTGGVYVPKIDSPTAIVFEF